jgi:hypothetical protein
VESLSSSDAESLIFALHSLRSDVTDPAADWQVLLYITADFSVYISGQLFYSEEEFPIIEFAVQANQWGQRLNGDFKYISMEAEESPLLSFEKQASGNYRISAYYQEFISEAEIPKQSIEAAMAKLIKDLRDTCWLTLKIDISRML